MTLCCQKSSIAINFDIEFHKNKKFWQQVYVKNGIESWIINWKKNGWKTAAKKPVKNEELWKRLELATELHDVSWEWIKGHAGHFENEQADELARNGMEPFKS